MKTIEIQADRLDSVMPDGMRGSVDMMKVDVEGCAYEVLKGSEETLAGNIVLSLDVETEFNRKYKDQHLFSDVDSLLRRYDYELVTMQECKWKRMAGLKTGGTEGQPVHAAAVYFLNLETFFRRIQDLGDEERLSKIVKFIVFCCIYGVYDIALELIEESTKRKQMPMDLVLIIRGALKKSQTISAKIPKLSGRGPAARLIYHAFMLTLGVWLEKFGYWKPRVSL